MTTSPTKEASETEETQEGEKPVPEVNGHAEDVEEKSEQVKERREEPDTNTSAGAEVLVEPDSRGLHDMTSGSAVLPDSQGQRGLTWRLTGYCKQTLLFKMDASVFCLSVARLLANILG